MKQGKTLTGLAAEIERQAGAKHDLVADTRALHLTSNGVSRLSVGEQGEYGMGELAHTQVATHLGIPKAYYDRMRSEQPDLLDRNVNTWFTEKPSRRMVRTLDGTARAFLSDKYRRLDHYDLLEASLPVLTETPGLTLASCEVTDSRLYLKVVTDRVQGEVTVGDVVRAGVLISNSEVGIGAVNVVPMTERLVCLNGATHADFGTRKNHVGRGIRGDGEEVYNLFSDDTLEADDKAFFLKVRDLIKGALSHDIFDLILSQMKDAAGARLSGDPVKAVEVLVSRHRLVESERTGVLRALVTGGDLSIWGVANALTAASQDALTYDRASELEALGGGLISAPSEWQALVEA